MDKSVLGSPTISCANCGRTIGLHEDRTRCGNCQVDCCLDCPSCPQHADHTVVRLRGFPQNDDDFDLLIEKASEIARQVGDRFPVNDNIYFSIVAETLPDLQSNPDSALHQTLPGDTVRWIVEHGEDFLRTYISLWQMGRLVDYFDRLAFSGRSADQATWRAAQGTRAPLLWRGLPMMRTAWDFALASVMIQDIQPGTIIELGTAAGGAAAYYADVQKCHGLAPNVVTLDKSPPRIDIDGVTVLQGDSNALAATLTEELLSRLPHPWMVIEDTHVNIRGIFSFFHEFLRNGDYICVEDIVEDPGMFEFLSHHRESYPVDAWYTDYFGYNNTCCPNQIFRRVDESPECEPIFQNIAEPTDTEEWPSQ